MTSDDLKAIFFTGVGVGALRGLFNLNKLPETARTTQKLKFIGKHGLKTGLLVGGTALVGSTLLHGLRTGEFSPMQLDNSYNRSYKTVDEYLQTGGY
ncbi:MAG: hypothetical protein QXW35_04370 [Candidatus Aenigmatarchaeota archaeon]